MDYPAAWRELAARFIDLHNSTSGDLYAVWHPSGVAPEWSLAGCISDTHHLFEWNAERGAVLLGYPPGADALGYWLNAVRAGSPRFSKMQLTHQRGGGMQSEEAGAIHNVCFVSAEYCYKLETLAIAKSTERAPRTLARIKKSQNVKPKYEPIESQIHRLRDECRWTVEQLAEKARLDPTTVYRHLSGTMKPSMRTIGAYERVFSNALSRKVVIEKTPVKRK